MSSITKSQYTALVAAADGAEVQCTEHDRDVLEARGLICSSHWMGNKSRSFDGAHLGWLRATVTSKGEELIAAKQGQAA